MKVVVSTGIGRLHLVSSTIALAQAKISVKLVCGWVPKTVDGVLVKMFSLAIGRDLSHGLRKRIINAPGIEVCPCALSEFVYYGLRFWSRVLGGVFSVDWVMCFSWRLYGFQSRSLIRECDIFHCRSGAGHGGAIANAKKLGLKVVVDHSIAHPDFLERQMPGKGISLQFWRIVDEDCRDADIIQVNSFFVRDTFVDAGYDPQRIRVVYLGVRPDFFGLRRSRVSEFDANVNAPLKFLFTGSFGVRKGGEYIVKACKILKMKGVAFSMDIVGSYVEAEQLLAECKEVGLPIRFHGPKSQDQLKFFLSTCDVYMFPSLAEGCAQSGMEAMAAGLCVVATHESGLPISDGINGFVVPAKNVEAIVDRILWLDFNRGVIDEVGQAAAKLIKDNYTWEKYAENTKRIYEELLFDHSSARQ